MRRSEMRRAGRRSVLALAVALSACASVPPEPPRKLPPPDLMGSVQTLRAGADDTLIDLAREHDLGYVEIVAANRGVDPWLPGDRDVVLPTAFVFPPGPRDGIVVNLAEQRLFLFRDGEPPVTFPIGVSRDGWKTPMGTTKVVRKKKDPVWYPGPTARVDYAHLGSAVPPGPDNPLGTHAIYLGWQAILIHGTNEPYGIGRRVSRGCIRLYPEDIVRLFPLVKKGMAVRVINEPLLLGWSEGELYLEAHPTLVQADQLEESGSLDPVSAPDDLRQRILDLAGSEASRLDWARVEQALEARSGVPVAITQPRPPERRGWLESVGLWLRQRSVPGAPRARTVASPSAVAGEEDTPAQASDAPKGSATPSVQIPPPKPTRDRPADAGEAPSVATGSR